MTVIQPASTPTPPELARAAELAALSLLDNALYTSAFALLAVNPRVVDADFEPQRLCAAVLAVPGHSPESSPRDPHANHARSPMSAPPSHSPGRSNANSNAPDASYT